MHRAVLAVATVAAFIADPTIALAQALLSDQRDGIAHMANAAIAEEQCQMQVNQEVMTTTMGHVGLELMDLEDHPYRAAFEEAVREAQLSIEVYGSHVVCDRLEAMYGPTGLRIPGLVAR
ncbi:hypothetical protein [Nitratireductor luteus]|uniref:hypothetical protein n=1 Tax=Nitratireductor luteus TaxID=2976980 RepID=UPI00223F23F0|nr:hypothetical protein [Nitratireductor luteus]